MHPVTRMKHAATDTESGDSFNSFEALARLRKVQALVGVLDRELGYRTGEEALLLAEEIEDWRIEQWCTLADRAGVHAPSARTIAMVLHALRRRAS